MRIRITSTLRRSFIPHFGRRCASNSIQFSPIEASRPGLIDRLARLATFQGDPELVGFKDNAAHGAIHPFGNNVRRIFLSHVLENIDLLASPSFARCNSFIEKDTNREKMESS
jgi:hypothetical protein